MDTNKKNHPLLNRLDKVELEMLHQNAEYAKQFLKEEGFDIEKESEYAEQFMKKVKFLSLAHSNKQKDLHLLEAAFARIKDAINENAQKTTEMLITLLHSKTPAVHYRKLENWTDDEIRDVLADVDLVKLMEELEKQK
jgi:hypothetical protein